MDQNKFLKQMQELVEFGRTKDNVLTKEEIADYCSDMSLTDKQLNWYMHMSKNTRSMSLVIRQAMMTRKKKARKAKKRQTLSISAFISRS